MASITYWNRVEPSPRSTDIGKALAARVRDALWMLTRQWQFGEFQGEDAGSPAWAELKTTSMTMTAWRPAGSGALHPIDPTVPLEKVVQSESFTLNLATTVELGQTFGILLRDAGLTSYRDAFRDAYRIGAPAAAELASGDAEMIRFREVAAGRALDGGALYIAARASLPALPAAPVIDPADIAAITTLLQRYVDWVKDVLGDLGTADAPSWVPRRLEYAIEVTTAPPPREPATVYAGDPGRDAELDWDTFDRTSNTIPGAPAGVADQETRTLLPAHVRFRGMPNARWWDFENASIDFGAIEPDRRDLAKLVVMDFMLLQSNDWFAIPIEQKVGTVLRVDSLVVRDVFGGWTIVPPVGDSRWTIFASSGGGRGFVLPPTAGAATQYGSAIEDIRFLRDEMANMVWAVEQTIEGGLGQPLQGYERASARASAPAPTPAQPGPDRPPLRYRLQTTVPENWIPFIPVAIDPTSGQVELERAAMFRSGTFDPILPAGRILNPSDTPYRVAEEEITREGVRVQRVIARARGVRGQTYLWISRRKTASRGPGWSGLRYDIAEPNT